MKYRILVSDPLEEAGLSILKKERNFSVDVRTALSPEELRKIIRNYDALVVRSATRVTREIIEAGKKLKVIGRAGVGVDNVDLHTATKRGIIVMNTPEGNSISTAEHSFSLLVSMARNIPQANQSVKKGEWKRTLYIGTELYGKTLGVVGFGRIGKEVAKRGKAFGMKVMVFDPFITQESAKSFEVDFVHDLKPLLRKSDFITVHTPLVEETRYLIDREEFALMKKGVRIINCARGGILHEKALLEALRSGKVKGAALDVFEIEPPKGNPLLELDSVVVTPHLGASTEEAQLSVAREVAAEVRDALLGLGIVNAVNLPSLDPEMMKILGPWLNLAERIGLLHTQLFEGRMSAVNVSYAGEVASFKLAPLTIALLKGLLTPMCAERVNFVNAPSLAKERGITVNENRTSTMGDFSNAISVEVRTNGKKNVIVGTLFGNKDPRIVRINEFYVEALPRGYMLVVTNEDKPGVVGAVGSLLGKHKINIAEMSLGRKRLGTYAITVINCDNEVPGKVLKELKSLKAIIDAKVIRL